MSGLDPSIRLLQRKMDCRVIGERSDAVLRTAMPDEIKALLSNAANSSALNLKFASLHCAFRGKLQIRKGIGKFMILAWLRHGNSLEALIETLTKTMKRASEPPHWREDECIGC
jgi:hypothetical protein